HGTVHSDWVIYQQCPLEVLYDQVRQLDRVNNRFHGVCKLRSVFQSLEVGFRGGRDNQVLVLYTPVSEFNTLFLRVDACDGTQAKVKIARIPKPLAERENDRNCFQG